MDNPIITVFYSNYSGNCKALLQYLKNSNLNSILTIKYINIDNTIMKNIISKKITVVPAMVVLAQDKVSLYSGENAFNWFNLYIESIQYNEEKKVEPELVEQQPRSPQNKSIMEIAGELSKERELF